MEKENGDTYLYMDVDGDQEYKNLILNLGNDELKYKYVQHNGNDTVEWVYRYHR